ncbi:hypothetical protein GF357_04335 [Candidatus Dojkabacteria bacterium]|nr:hypothetical protein [Candidatus Dojkabacteria bacterium]
MGFIPLLIIIFIVGMYIFWRESKLVNKNLTSIFDQWVFAAVITAVWGRMSYIIANWSQYAQTPWFYLPYEKYGSDVYFFRLLPWRFLAIWDGGFLFTGLITAFVVFNFVYVTFIKKWKWDEMLAPVVVSSHFILGAILTIYGVFLEQQDIIIYGGVLLGIVVLFYLLRFAKRQLGEVIYIDIFYILASFGFVAVVFWIGNISWVDKLNVVVLMILAVLISLVYYRDSNEPDIEEDSQYESSRPVSISTNKAIKVKNE